MLRETLPNKCTFFGCIGNDDEGKVLERELEATGIHGNFHKDDETPTASCAVIVINQERTLCANLSACLKYPTEHLKRNMEIV